MLVDMHLTIFMGLTLQVRGYGKADKEVSVGQLQESVVVAWLTKRGTRDIWALLAPIRKHAHCPLRCFFMDRFGIMIMIMTVIMIMVMIMIMIMILTMTMIMIMSMIIIMIMITIMMLMLILIMIMMLIMIMIILMIMIMILIMIMIMDTCSPPPLLSAHAGI